MINVMWDAGADQSLGLPRYETAGAAGADLRANLPDGGVVDLPPGARALIPTGLRMQIPQGYEVQIRPRSGLALKQGLTLLNAPGTIDSDYRGPVGVIVVNHGTRRIRPRADGRSAPDHRSDQRRAGRWAVAGQTYPCHIRPDP